MSRKKAAVTRNSTDDDLRPLRPARERLETWILEELWSIWRADPRVPSIRSRRVWAISRNANPRLVDSWFLRRKMCAKKAGQPIANDSYHLPLDPAIAPKREQSTTFIEPELETIPDLPSDDTLVYPPDVDDLNELDTSSDTVFDEGMFIESKRPERPAYKEAPQHHDYSQRKPSSTNCLFENVSFPVCDQGWRNRSSFRCILCSSKSTQDEPDSNTMSNSRANLSIPCSRLDFSPTTLSELSAIPFLFRTPPTVPPDTASHQSVDNWSIIEDELGCLVNDGNLDFSFLDVPHLACMELIN